MGILKRVIITPAFYPRFFEFLHVDIQSAGHRLSRPWLRQPNDVMSEIECAQLHNELIGRRHTTLQSPGFFALAKHLLIVCPMQFMALDRI